MGILDIVPAGVVSGKDVYKVFDYARENHFAIPAFNVTVCSALRISYLSDFVRCQRRSRGRSRVEVPCYPAVVAGWCGLLRW